MGRKESNQTNQRGLQVQIKDAALVKIQIGLAFYLKRQRSEENTLCSTIYHIYQGVIFLL